MEPRLIDATTLTYQATGAVAAVFDTNAYGTAVPIEFNKDLNEETLFNLPFKPFGRVTCAVA